MLFPWFRHGNVSVVDGGGWEKKQEKEFPMSIIFIFLICIVAQNRNELSRYISYNFSSSLPPLNNPSYPVLVYSYCTLFIFYWLSQSNWKEPIPRKAGPPWWTLSIIMHPSPSGTNNQILKITTTKIHIFWQTIKWSSMHFCAPYWSCPTIINV